MNKKIICVVGPTASGKTGLAVRICQEFNGEIISADSRQVCRFLNLGTGKEGSPRSEAKLKVKSQKSKEIAENTRYINGIPQWVIDVAEPEERFTLFDWLESARAVIEDIFKRGKVPIVVGGTGLYVQALVEGFKLENVKSKKLNVKKYSRNYLDRQPTGNLINILKKIAPEKIKEIDAKNPRRLIRAIEMTQQKSKPTKVPPDFEVLQLGITLARQELYQKIDHRVEERFKQGMLEEVEGLLARGVDSKWLLSLGLEYKIIGNYVLKNEKLKIKNAKLQGGQKEEKYNQMKQELKYKIHAYARRQLTWFRRFPQIKWVKNFTEAKKLINSFLK